MDAPASRSVGCITDATQLPPAQDGYQHVKFKIRRTQRQSARKCALRPEGKKIHEIATAQVRLKDWSEPFDRVLGCGSFSSACDSQARGFFCSCTAQQLDGPVCLGALFARHVYQSSDIA